MPHPELRPENLAIMRAMSGPKADLYVDEVLIPSLARACRVAHDEQSIRLALAGPYSCLEAIYSHYAFARRGKDRYELSEAAAEALHRIADEDDFGQFLALDNAESLWSAFAEVCRERGRKPMEQLNSGVIAGMAELAQEIAQIGGSGSIAEWIASGIRQSGRVEPQFLRMVDVRGIGPKITSLILRDVVFFFDLEDLVEPADRLYIQPIDKWTRMIAPYVIDEPNADDLADWILAGKFSKYTRRAGVSGIRFNMGTSLFGMREVRAPEFFDSAIRYLLKETMHQPQASAELR